MRQERVPGALEGRSMWGRRVDIKEEGDRDDGQVGRRAQELGSSRSQAEGGTGMQTFLNCAGCVIPLLS